MSVQIDESRLPYLQDEFEKPYFTVIKQTLLHKREQWETIYPPGSLIFNAFNTTHFDDVKVVILGQDPYHGPWQAHGLSFSVLPWVKIPPSLRNIYKEIESDVWWPVPTNWDLTYLAQQWVFLLNSILTVTAWQPASHKKIGRERFTDAVLKAISDNKEWVVFILRWAFARSKVPLIDQWKHTVLESPHPSPFSADKGFFWSKPFSKANKVLESQWQTPINWTWLNSDLSST